MNGPKNFNKNRMKIVKESLDDDNSQIISESGGFRIGGITYDVIRSPEGIIYSGQDGILGYNGKLISWKIIRSLLKKYSPNT